MLANLIVNVFLCLYVGAYVIGLICECLIYLSMDHVICIYLCLMLNRDF